jgi:protocatechuate 3,4-dioxygenase beta subunit
MRNGPRTSISVGAPGDLKTGGVMRRLAILALVLTLLTLGGVISALTTPSPARAATPPTGISGVVKDTSGRPLSAIEVTVFRQNDWGWYDYAAIATTGASGAYKITGLTAGTYRAHFLDPQGRYAPVYFGGANDLWSATDIAVVSGAVTSGANARLMRCGSVSGTITEADGTPVFDAWVWVEVSNPWGSYGLAAATTDETGHYTIASIRPTGPDEQYDVRAGSGYFHDASYRQVNGTDGFSLAEGQALFGIDLQLLEYERITGTVRNSSGEPLQGIWAEVLRWDEYYGWCTFSSASTDEQGSYDLWAGEAGSYRVRFRDDAHVYADRFYGGQATAEEATPVDVAPGQTVTGIDGTMELMPPSSISGTVTGAGPAPLAGATVKLYHEYWGEVVARTTTSFDGTYSFLGLKASEFVGDYRIQCAAEGYVTRWYDGVVWDYAATPIVLGAGQQIVADLQLAHPDPTCRIGGRVTNAAGDPIAGVQVEIGERVAGSSTYATTAADGSYSVEGLEPGTYFAGFWAEDYLWTFWGSGAGECPGPEADITLASHEARDDIAAVLHRWNSVSGRVTLTDGRPVAEALVSMQSADGGSDRYAWTSDDGTYSQALGPGRYIVRFSHDDEVQYYDGVTEEVEATPIVFDGWDGTVADVDAQFAPPGARLEGTVSASSGGSVAGVEVAAYVYRWGDVYEAARTTVNDDGSYSIPGLKAGTYLLGFFDPQGRYGGEFYDDQGQWNDPAAEWIELTKDQVITGRDALLGPGGNIQGTVTDENGVALAGVTVEAHYRGLWGECGIAGQFVRTAVTGADGSYSIGALTAGRYRVHFVAPDSSYAMAAWYLDQEQEWQAPVTVDRDQTTPYVDQELPEGGRISGTITDGAGELYTLGGSVQATHFISDGYDTWSRCAIAADGSFLTSPLPPGDYRIGFELSPPFVNLYWPDKADMWEGDLVTVVAGQTSSIAVTAQREASISGTVRDSTGPVQREDGEYYGPVRLYRQIADGSWRDAGHSGTDADGRFTFTHLRPGAYRVYVSGWQGSCGEWWDDAHVGSLPTDIVLSEGQSGDDVDVVLDPQGTVSGKAVDGSGTPLSGIPVVAYGRVPDWSGNLEATSLSSTVTDDNGRYTLTVDPGQCWLYFNDRDAWPYDYIYTMEGSGDLTVAPGAELSGIDAMLRSTWVDFSSTTHPDQDRWYNGDEFTVSWVPRDPTYVTGYTYFYDTGSGSIYMPEVTQETSFTYPVPGDGTWWFQLNVRDPNDNEWGYTFRFNSDRSAPETTVSGAGATGVWKTTPVRLRYSAYDAYSGVAFTETSVDGGPWIKGATYKVTTDGTHTIAYRSTDNVGNVEDPQTLLLRIDRTAPVTTQAGADDAWHNAAVTVRFAATDAISGMTAGLATTRYSTDNGVTWTTGTSITVKGALQGGTDGEHPILYQSVDAAGNTETPKAVNVKMDTRAPTTLATAVVTATRDTTVSLPYRVNDPLPTSGTAMAWVVIRDENDRVMATLPKVVVAVNQPQTQTYLCALKPGTYRYWVKAVDVAGNQEQSSGANKLIVK